MFVLANERSRAIIKSLRGEPYTNGPRTSCNSTLFPLVLKLSLTCNRNSYPAVADRTDNFPLCSTNKTLPWFVYVRVATMRNEKPPAEIISFFRVYEHAVRDESVFLLWELTYSLTSINLVTRWFAGTNKPGL